MPLKSRLLFEQEGNPQPTTIKILETNIDELMKNKIDLLSKKTLNEQERSNLKGYGSYATYVGNENEKLRMYIQNFQVLNLLLWKKLKKEIIQMKRLIILIVII